MGRVIRWVQPCLALSALTLAVCLPVAARAAIVAENDPGGSTKPAATSRLDDIIIYEKIALAWNSHISVIVREPELRPYFTDRQAVPPSGAIRFRVLAYAETRIDIADFILTVLALAGSKPEQTKGWQNTVAVAFEESPAMCVVFKQHKKIYGFGLTNAFGEAVCGK